MESDSALPPESGAEQAKLRKHLRTGFVITTVLLALVTGGVQAALIKLLNLDEALSMIQVFYKTAPLTLALTLSFLGWMFWMSRDAKDAFPKWFVLTGLCLWGAAELGNALGALQVEMPPALYSSTDPWESFKSIWVIRAIRGYYAAYGLVSFWSSIILSGFLVFSALRVMIAREEQIAKTQGPVWALQVSNLGASKR